MPGALNYRNMGYLSTKAYIFPFLIDAELSIIVYENLVP